MPYLATINTPGYLPQDDEPPVFDTAEEAWGYLAEEREETGTEEQSEEDYLADVWHYLIAQSENASGDGTGSVIGSTPGYDGDHDLGLAYSVTYLDEHDERAYPFGTTERLDCGCLAHNTRMTGFGFHCDAEDQGYCNFEHACGLDD
jgi:hypothetical protein